MRRLHAVAFLVLCGCGSRRMPLECPNEGPTKSEFSEDKTYERYTVEGDHPNTFLANARAQRPFSADASSPDGTGLTESKLCLHWQMLFDASSCRIGAVRLVHKVRITLPTWKRPNDTSPAFVAWDEHASAQLAQHEEGHYLLATALARALYEKALTITSAPTCDELDRQFDALIKATQAEMLEKQTEYDAMTKHGTAEP